jgi:hypothetical protein
MNTTAPKVTPSQNRQICFKPTITSEERKQSILSRYTGNKGKIRDNHLVDLNCPGGCECKGWSAGYDPEKAYSVIKCYLCHGEWSHRELFPDMYEKSFVKGFNKANPTTPFNKLSWEDKALAFLTIGRGLPEEVVRPLIKANKIKVQTYFVDGFEQEAVMFRYENGNWNGRIIDPKGKQKPHSEKDSSISTTFFLTKPLNDYDFSKDTRIAESPIKALALEALGIQSIGLSSAIHLNDPKKPQLAELKKLGFTKLSGAFDNDKGGTGQGALKALDSALKSTEQSLGITAGTHIQPFISGKDWDDLLKDGKEWADIQDKCENSAYLELAEGAQDWVNRSVKIKSRNPKYYIPAVFPFEGKTYFYVKIEKTKETEEIHKAELCCEATFKIEATVIHESKHSWRLRITEPSGETEVITVEASQLKGEGLETFLLERSIIYKPKPQSWKILVGHLLKRQSIPRAVQLDYVGYHLESGSYLFPSWGISKNGELLTPNQFGAYEVDIEGQKKYFIPSQNVKMVEAKPSDFKTKEERSFILESFLCAMGTAYPKTIGVMISHQLATLYCPLIKEESYGVPFYGIKGPKGTGKTESVKCLLEAFGLKVEGISLVSSNEKAIRRELSHLSGCLYYYDETNDEESGSRSSKVIKDHESKMLPCYGKATIHAQGEKNTGNSIHKSYYRGNQIYTYNFSPWKTEAFKSRLIESKVIPEYLTKDSRDAYRRWKELESPRNRQLAGIAFLEATIKPFADSWQSEIIKARKFLDEHHPTSSQRTLENFQIILAANRILKKVFPQLKDHSSLDLEVPYDGEETPKIHILVEQHERRCNTNDSLALKTLINALNDIGAIDMSRRGGRPEGENHNDIFQWGDDGLKVYLHGMVNNENGDKVLRAEKKEIEQELHRVEGASQKKIKIWGKLQSGWVLTPKALETIIGITDGDDRD